MHSEHKIFVKYRSQYIRNQTSNIGMQPAVTSNDGIGIANKDYKTCPEKVILMRMGLFDIVTVL
jgi:hypothetical protein